MCYHTRGARVCANNLEVPLLDVDAAVLAAVEHQLLRVEVLETVLYKAVAALNGPDAPDPAGTLRAELARLEAKISRLAAAIAAGGNLESLVGLLQERERRRAQIRTTLTQQERQQHARRHDAGDAPAVMRKALADWRGDAAAGSTARTIRTLGAPHRPARLHAQG